MRTDGRGIVTCYGNYQNGNCDYKGYDALGRVVRKSYSDGTPAVSYGYGVQRTTCPDMSVDYAAGRLLYMSNGVSTYGYNCYDALGRPRQGIQTTGGRAYTFNYLYNPAGVTSLTYPSGRVVSYGYSGAAQVNKVSKGALTSGFNYATGLTYTAHGPLSGITFGNGLTMTNGYNARLQPNSMNAQFGNSALLTLNYYYCPSLLTTCSTNNDNVQGQTMYSVLSGLTMTQLYSYDTMNRLTSAQENNNNWVQNYAYDGVGNRWVTLSPNFAQSSFMPISGAAYDVDNRLTMGGATYDLSGNQLQIGGYGLHYDAESRMTSSTVNGVTTSYGYDGDGRRVIRSSPTVGTTVYVYDPLGQLASQYSLAPPGVPCTTCYLTMDVLGSLRMLTDQTGARAMHDYLPFGEEIPAGINGRTSLWSTSDGIAQRFTAKERDTTGDTYMLDFFGARYFSGAQARFTSPDPDGLGATIGDPQSWNMYSYGRNNPLKYTDPFGQNYTVCDAAGDNCRDLTDKEYNKYRQSLRDSGAPLYVDAGGNVKFQNGNGSFTLVGTATYYNEKDIQGARQIAQTGAIVNPLLEITLAFIMGPGFAASEAPSIATMGMLGGKLATGASVEPSTPVGRGNTREWNTKWNNVGSTVNGRFYTGHALDEMQAQGMTPSVVEDTIARGVLSPGNSPGTWKYSTEQASVVVNRGGNVVTTHLGGR